MWLQILAIRGSEAGDEACALDILFLRRDQPGDLLPVATDERINDVYLVIHVRTISFAEVITV